MLLILSGDKPIFEYNFNKPQKLQTYFHIHSCLDAIETALQFRKQFYLGQIRTEQIPIFCYMNATGLKLILVFTNKKQFDKKADVTIRDFLIQVNRNLTTILMNPLYGGGVVGGKRNRKNDKNPSFFQNSQIRSTSFQERIYTLGKQHLRPFFEKKKSQTAK